MKRTRGVVGRRSETRAMRHHLHRGVHRRGVRRSLHRVRRSRLMESV
jgi:hypothetical protein